MNPAFNTTPPTECPSWGQLVHHAESWRDVRLKDLFANDVARSVQFVAEAPGAAGGSPGS